MRDAKPLVAAAVFCSVLTTLLLLQQARRGMQQQHGQLPLSIRDDLETQGISDTLYMPGAQETSKPRLSASTAQVCDLPEFELMSEKPLNVTIFVFAWRRLTSLRRLIRSLQSSEYCGRRVPLHILLDSGALPAVREVCSPIELGSDRSRMKPL